MKTALITGVAGQDGAYLARLLLGKGYRVAGLEPRLRVDGLWRLDFLDVKAGVRLIEGDVTDERLLARVLEEINPDEVYNLAATSFVGLSWEQPVAVAHNTGVGVLRVLETIRRRGRPCRFYQACSSELFGAARDRPQSERTPFAPRNPYGASKLFGYWMTAMYRQKYGLFACNGISYNHESPLRGLEFVTRKITDAAARIKAGLQQELRLGDLDAQRDWGFAGDYVEAMWLMLQQEKPDDFVIASGKTASVRDLCRMAFGHLGLEYEQYVVVDPEFKRPPETGVLVGDIAKARAVLGWEPKTSLESVIRMMVDADLKRIQTPPEVKDGPALAGSGKERRAARLIAFFLPQFHSIPENDQWWGKGFTEWRNVARAKPLFPGHKQPKQPADLGFYDLRVPEVRQQQADLAARYGIEAFCYWHYWFDGKLLLERPILDMLSSGKPDFPFCLAWANEPWSRRWSGEPLEVLQDQVYGGGDDQHRHFHWLLPAFRDPRALKIDGKPVFLIYKPNHIPEINEMISLWRRLAVEQGLPGLYLIAVETAVGSFDVDPRGWGFDASMEFQPHWIKLTNFTRNGRSFFQRALKRLRCGKMWVLDYPKLWPHLAIAGEKEYPFYPCVFPRWDNTPRRGKNGLVIHRSTPDEYGAWLRQTIDKISHRPREHRLVFINAWNEWAEGNYLEPDFEFGAAYLEATRRANPADDETGREEK